jgi:ABC-type branched-subunit amino acid transport system substrate-binding protein
MLMENSVSVLGAAQAFGVLHGAGAGLPGEVRRRDRQKLRIAHFTSLSGSAGIWGPPSVNSAILAAGEINRHGGILGREIELVIHDAGQAPEDLT